MYTFPHKLVQEKVDWYLWKKRMHNTHCMIHLFVRDDDDKGKFNYLLNKKKHLGKLMNVDIRVLNMVNWIKDNEGLQHSLSKHFPAS